LKVESCWHDLAAPLIIAIAASVGRHKDLARIEQLLDQAKIDKPMLDDILRRYNLKLPKP